MPLFAPAGGDRPLQMKCAACTAGGAPCPACAGEGEKLQRKQLGADTGSRGASRSVEASAHKGLAGPSQSLPHLGRIQAAFGGHDLSGVKAHVGGAAARANDELGAVGYTLGERVAFRSTPDVKLAAHEAAHVIQQRSGVALEGGIDRPGDEYERAADHVAEAVARGDRVDPEAGAPAGVPAYLQRQAAQAAGAGSRIDLRARVNQLQLAIRLVPFPRPHFAIDPEAVAAALSGLTAEDGRAIRTEYRERTKLNLGWLISGEEQLGNNLGKADRKYLLNLLAGTVATSSTGPEGAQALGELAGSIAGGVASVFGAEDADQTRAIVAATVEAGVLDREAKAEAAAAINRHTAAAAAIKAALDRGAAETVLEVIRGPDKQAIAEQYDRHYGESLYNALVTRLKGRDAERVRLLWLGDSVTADRLALEGDRERQRKVEAQLAELGSSGLPGVSEMLKQRQREARAAVESRLEALGGEAAGAVAASQGLTHLQAVLAGPEGDALEIAFASDPVLGALTQAEEPEALGARLARADREGSLKNADVEAALRQLGALAERTAIQKILREPALAQIEDTVINLEVEHYYRRFTKTFNANSERSLYGLLARVDDDADLLTRIHTIGSELERERNRALLAGRGVLPEWQELDFALRSRPKDVKRVRKILGTKTRSEIDALSKEYHDNTSPQRSLEADLMGTVEEQALERFKDADAARESEMEKRMLLQGGTFESRASDEATRLAEEGAWTYRRIYALRRRVIENRGAFAQTRDWLGNLEYELLARDYTDATDAKIAFENAMGMTEPDLATARAQLVELRRAHVRLENSVGVYKEATKAAYDEFVDFAVFVISTAVTLGQGGAILMAIRGTAATIGTKLVLKGDEYGFDEFVGDLQLGLVGAGVGKVAESVLIPLAGRLVARAKRLRLWRSMRRGTARAGAEGEGALAAAAPEPHPVAAEPIPERSPGSPGEPDARVRESGQLDSPKLSMEQVADEVAFIEANPQLVQPGPPRNARIGKHTWVENPGGGWCRHSNGWRCVPGLRFAPGAPPGGARTASFGGRDETMIKARIGQLDDELAAQGKRGFSDLPSVRDVEAAVKRGDIEAADELLSDIEDLIHNERAFEAWRAGASGDVSDIYRGSTAAPEVHGRAEMRASRLRPDDPLWTARAAGMESGSSYGRAAERMADDFVGSNFADVRRQVRISPILDNGQVAPWYFIADDIGRAAGGRTFAFDTKLTSGAPYTAPQQIGYPLLARNGGVIRSRGLEGLYPDGALAPTPTFRVQPRFNIRPRAGVPDIDFGDVEPTHRFFRLRQDF